MDFTRRELEMTVSGMKKALLYAGSITYRFLNTLTTASWISEATLASTTSSTTLSVCSDLEDMLQILITQFGEDADLNAYEDVSGAPGSLLSGSSIATLRLSHARDLIDHVQGQIAVIEDATVDGDSISDGSWATLWASVDTDIDTISAAVSTARGYELNIMFPEIHT